MTLLNQIIDPSFLYIVIRVTVPILLPALGAYVTSKAGVPNIGLEGIMLVAAFFGVIASAFTHSGLIGLGAAILSGILMALFLAYFTLKLKADVILAGIAINFFSSSLTIFLLYLITGDKGTSSSLPSETLPNVEIPIIKFIPYIGKVISNQNILVYLTIIIIIFMIILMNKTALGKHIKAVGENPAAAESVGINVAKVRLIAFVISGVVCGISGAYLSMGYVSWFSRDMTAGRGWIAIAAEAMGRGTLTGTILSSFLFGISMALSNIFQLYNIPTELIGIFPNVVTVLALVIYSIVSKKKADNRA